MRKKTVLIGIPAHNEQSNIANLLDSIIIQKGNSFTLTKVIVICDGCEDNTANIVAGYCKKYKNFTVIDDNARFGKAARLNELYRINTGDILITFDGDSLLGSDNVIEEIVRTFSDESVGLVGGGDRPFPAKTFFEKIVVSGIELWYLTRKDINNGSSLYNHHGCVSALSKSFSEKVIIPTDIVAEDSYLYFRSLELGFKFKFAKNAIVYYRAPGNLRDYLLQTKRFLNTKDIITSHFGSWVNDYRYVPKSLKIKAIFKMILKEPVFMPLSLILSVYIRLIKKFSKEIYKGGIWTSVVSTKSKLVYEK